MTDEKNIAESKNFGRKVALIGIARWVGIISFLGFLPTAVMCSALSIEFKSVVPVITVIFMGFSAYAMFARCPRCHNPWCSNTEVLGERPSRKRAEHPFLNSRCIHCGQSFSLLNTNTQGYPNADLLGVGALPIVVRFKGLLKFIGASIANMILCIFLFGGGFFGMAWYWHVATFILSYTALTGVFEILTAARLFDLMKKIRLVLGWKRAALIASAVGTLLLSPLYTWFVFQLLGRFVF